MLLILKRDFFSLFILISECLFIMYIIIIDMLTVTACWMVQVMDKPLLALTSVRMSILISPRDSKQKFTRYL